MNDAQGDTDSEIYLGKGTNGCMVVCKRLFDDVENLGTNKKLIGWQ